MTSSSFSLLGMLAGVLIALGIAGAIAVLRGWQPRRRIEPGALRRRARRALEELPLVWQANYRYLLAASAVLGVVMWAWTGWPVHGLLAAGALAGLPFILHPGGSGRVQIARLEALAEWLQQLASVISGGKPLSQAVQDLTTVPAALRREVGLLQIRLASGVQPAEAYRLFADDMGERVGDDVAMLFCDHLKTHGPRLSHILASQASLVAHQAADLTDIDAERAKARSTARRVSLFALLVVAVLLANPAYTAPYGTPLGQLGMIAWTAAFIAALMWLRRMARPRPEPRLLLTAAQREETSR
ncbi:type II secretion system F family protein [Streptomyces sp. WM6378]|uniref:type II secretion system F family protein n=1 Tax=Streptomyces sp. WM6378 TaxID=1415557 RepID=UPI0006AF7D02|nr:hypothetical protein [Streptomyces sp. WM6378]KOU37619.1 hypothetical protein ADK54_31365 [Streptomyces sp. WM6378]